MFYARCSQNMSKYANRHGLKSLQLLCNIHLQKIVLIRGSIKGMRTCVNGDFTVLRFIIYVGCRGDEEKMFISDTKTILYNDFVQKFCALDNDRPKMFLFQVVTGSASTLFRSFDKNLSDMKNTLICHLREPWTKFESTINVGSWLLQNFVDVFMREVNKKDLVTIIKIVKESIQLSLGSIHRSLFSFRNFGVKNVYFDLSETENNKYSMYITRHLIKLSKKCEPGKMLDIIKYCEQYNIFTPEDRKNLVGRNKIEITKFWELIIEKPIRLSVLTDIFYDKRMFTVVKFLHKATKDDNSDTLCQDLKNWQPLKVEVVKQKTPEDFSDDAYQLDADYIGLALVINIIEYEIGSRRHGAENDGLYMMELWSQMGYKVIKYEGEINKEKFKAILDDFIELVNRLNDLSTKKRCESCVVYVGCHGLDGEIKLSDGHKVELYNHFIFTFEKLVPLNIPKIFIVQSCRKYVQKMSFDESLKIKERLSQMKPMLVCFSSSAGEESNRDAFVGSLYTYIFSKVFMEYAYKMELKQLLDKVEKELLHIFDEKEIKQKCQFENYDMDFLYFNIKPFKK